MMYSARGKRKGGLGMCKGEWIATRIKIIDNESKRTVETTVGLPVSLIESDLKRVF